jgi:Protein of unknown function (DUF3313)
MRCSRCWLIGLGVLALSACAAQTESVERPPQGAVAEPLEPAQGERGAWTYLAPDVDLKKYTRFILERPRVYRGEGASYPSNLSQQDLDEIAQGFLDETRAALEPKYPIVTEPGPDVGRLRFTLIGVEQTVPYASTVTRLIPVGAAINMVSSAAGGGGTLTGPSLTPSKRSIRSRARWSRPPSAGSRQARSISAPPSEPRRLRARSPETRRRSCAPGLIRCMPADAAEAKQTTCSGKFG